MAVKNSISDFGFSETYLVFKGILRWEVVDFSVSQCTFDGPGNDPFCLLQTGVGFDANRGLIICIT